MLSSFNVIKNDNVMPRGDRDIITKFQNPVAKEISEKYGKEHIESYENLAKNMLENARIQSEKILTSTYEEVGKLEKNANAKVDEIKREAYEKGFSEGSTKGYNDAYESAITKASLEAEKIKKNADDVLISAQKEYKDYIEIKKNEILNTIIKISESILNQEVKSKDSVGKMVFRAIENEKNANRFVIKCNSLYSEEIKKQVVNWKEQLALKVDVFVVSDDSITQGNAVVEKDNGKIMVGIDTGMEKLKSLFMENEF